ISAGGNSAAAASFAGASADGTQVLFTTTESLAAADADGGYQDVYERAGGQTTLVSSGGNAPVPAEDARISADGSTSLFTSREQLTAGEDDGAQRDIFARTAAGLMLVTPGTLTSDDNMRAVSADG